MSDAGKKLLGVAGERVAADFLVARGWQILDRNWRYRSWELDLICRQEDTIVFVEVKTRRSGGMTGPQDAFNRNKQRTLVKAARAWLAQKNAWSANCRFDLVVVTRMENSFQMELICDVIQLAPGNPVSGRYSHWQPW